MKYTRKPFTNLRTLPKLRTLTECVTRGRNGRTTEAADAAPTHDEALEADGAPTFGLRHG